MLDTRSTADDAHAVSFRPRAGDDSAAMEGTVLVEWYGPDGQLKSSETISNLITAVGINGYVARGSGAASAPAAPTGLKLGTSAAAVTSTGSGAALGNYLAGSNKAFDSGFPSVSGGVVTYKRTYAAGEASSASAITECVLVNDSIATDATSTAANTWARFLLTSPAAKEAGDVLVVTWTHTIA